MFSLMKCVFQIAFLLCFMASCVGKAPEFDSNVIEASKKEPPYWVGLKLNKLHRVRGNVIHITRKSLVLNLGLGIKQARIEAVNNFLMTLRGFIGDRIKDLARKKGVKVLNKGYLNKLLSKAITSLSKDNISIYDIYFQRLSKERYLDDNDSSFYRIYVLIRMNPVQFESFLGALAETMVGSEDEVLKLIGRDIKAGKVHLLTAP